jgi:hypothetical protein
VGSHHTFVWRSTFSEAQIAFPIMAQAQGTTTGAAYSKLFPVSWSELHRDAKALAWRLADRGPFKGLVVVTRGGMVPAG